MMTVTSLNTKIKSLLEATFMHIMVEGEVAQVTHASSGHLYFALKDEQSTLKCVMWKSAASKLKFALTKGEHVVIEGSIGVYTPRGEYQCIATHVEPFGQGALAVAFEQLKTKLKTKGYFDAHKKKKLPKYPGKLVLVTAAGSAALQDMLKVAQKRWTAVEITVIDVLVQGERAAGEIAGAIAYADGLEADMIVIGRGGGSAEDLWAFNEEIVADAIYEAQTPVVSAVGHEVDTLISDFVADLRAPTPSAAMEMILPDGNELRYMLDERAEQLDQRMAQLLSQKSQHLQSLHATLLRFSLGSRLHALHREFGGLASDLAQTMHYRLSQFTAMALPLSERLDGSMGLVLRRASGETEGILRRFALVDPRQQARGAWAQINKNGKKVLLDEIEEGEVFNLVNDRVKIRAKALKKKSL